MGVCKLFRLSSATDEVISYSKTFSKKNTSIKSIASKTCHTSRQHKGTENTRISRLLTPLKIQRRKARNTGKNKSKGTLNSEAIRYHELLISRLKRKKNFNETLAKRTS